MLLNGNEECFILGAGFSKALNEKMPLLSELSNKIWDTNNWSDPYDILQFPEYPDELESIRNAGYVDDIEMLLAYLAIEYPWETKEYTYKKKYLYELISRWITKILIVKEYEAFHSFRDVGDIPPWMEKLLRYWHRTEATIITFNYDTCVERCFLNKSKSILDREPSNSDLSIIYPEILKPIRGRSFVGLSQQRSIDTFEVLKLHGSINWFYSGRDEFAGESVTYISMEDVLGGTSMNQGVTMDDVIKDELSLRSPLADKSIFIVPPLVEKTEFYKNLGIQELWRRAYQSIRTSESIYCLGFSFTQTDHLLRHLFSYSGYRSKKKKEFYPVNSPTHETYDKREIDFIDHCKCILPESYYDVRDEYLASLEEGKGPIQKFVDNHCS